VTGDALSVRLTIAAAAFVLFASPLHAADGIGKAAAVTTVVTGTLGGGTAAPIAKGDDVFQNQVIETDESGVGQIEFVDKTKLAIGPGSTMTLDTFVYNPNKTAEKVVIELGKGSFRFITGKSPSTVYEISTPTATLGLRGTGFDIRVAPNGEIALAMTSGAVEVCSTISGACQVHDIIGKFLHIGPNGLFTLHDTWDGTFMQGVEFATALPFMANQNVLQPAFKTTRRVATLYGNAAGQVIEAPIKAAKPVGDFLKKLNPFK
jgi:hypothetical protein